MKRSSVLSIVMVAVAALMMSACASYGPQIKLRGDNRGTPGIRVTPMDFGISQQELANMPEEDYRRLMTRIDQYNVRMRDMSYNEAYDAYAKKQWYNNVEGGPPSTPQGWGVPNPSVAPRAGVFDERTRAMREEADRLWRDVDKILKK